MMTRNLKVFLAASVGSVSVWWGINALNEALTDVFFAYEMRTNPAVLAATAAQLELEQQIQEAYPLAQNALKFTQKRRLLCMREKTER